jgi:hypothetical protein
MLCKDYFTYEKRADQSGGSPHCRSCSQTNQSLPSTRPIEDLVHILAECSAYSEVRNRILPEMEHLCKNSKSKLDFQNILCDKNKLCQFILDPTSLNLAARISMNDPNLESFFRKSRDYCYSIHNTRLKILKQKDGKQIGIK